MRLLTVAAVAALSFAGPFALASTIYTYTGQTYTSATLPYTTSESVTGSFTVSSPLAANLQNSTVTPTAFSFSDGVQTLTNSTALSDIFGISTDANGNITSYSIQINNATLGYIKLSGVGGGLSGDSVRLTTGTSGMNTTAGVFRVSGTAVTPEPESLWLLGTGVLGAAGAVRRRLS